LHSKKYIRLHYAANNPCSLTNIFNPAQNRSVPETTFICDGKKNSKGVVLLLFRAAAKKDLGSMTRSTTQQTERYKKNSGAFRNPIVPPSLRPHDLFSSLVLAVHVRDWLTVMNE
jgi:hypothetical protein